MPSCVACGAELEPPVRTPHTVYVKSLYRTAGQDYCRHCIIRAGGGPVVALTRGASSNERPRPYQHRLDARHRLAQGLGIADRPGDQGRGDPVLAGAGSAD